MRFILLLSVVLCIVVSPVFAHDLIESEADALLQELPPEAAEVIEDTDIDHRDFMASLLSVVKSAFQNSTVVVRDGLRSAGILLGIVLLCSICCTQFSNNRSSSIVGVLGIFAAIMGSMGSMVQLSKDTIGNITDFSGLLLPIMASAMAVAGNPTAAAGLHAGTALFAQLLMRLTSNILIPGVFLFLAIAAAESAIGNSLLGELREFICWLIEKSLRLILYTFTGLMSITGVISGNADAMAIKATKAAVSGMVPVVGGILSDASETMLAGATLVKNSIGLIGMLVVVSIVILPFVRVGIQYLIMKGTAACAGAIGLKEHVQFLKHISTAMGLLLGMTGACAMLLLISGVCYLKVMVV